LRHTCSGRKLREAAEIDLAGSNLLSCTLEDLPGITAALQLTAPNDNGFAPLVESIATHSGVVPGSRGHGHGMLRAPTSSQSRRWWRG
jgi:hypothetical protein